MNIIKSHIGQVTTTNSISTRAVYVLNWSDKLQLVYLLNSHMNDNTIVNGVIEQQWPNGHIVAVVNKSFGIIVKQFQ